MFPPLEPTPETPPPGAPTRSAPGRAEALAFYGVLLVLVLPDLLAQASNRVLGLAWSELFTMLLPAAVAAAGSNLRVARALGLGRARPLPIALGALLGAAGFLAANGVMALWVMVLPDRLLEVFPDVGRIFEGGPVARAVVIAVAVLLAPLCEEAAFRGYLQRTLLGAMRPAWAIAITALLFAARHLDPVRFPALILLGALFGWLAWRSGSLWPAVAAHAANNALAAGLALLGVGGDAALARPTLVEALGPLLVGGAVTAGLAAAFRSIAPAPAGPDAVARRDPGDPSTRFRAHLVPRAMWAAALAGAAALFALLASSAE
jgi:membrane protease YdiL (CAAX protease family)